MTSSLPANRPSTRLGRPTTELREAHEGRQSEDALNTGSTAIWTESPYLDVNRPLITAPTDDLTVPDTRVDTTARRLLLAGSRAFATAGVSGASLLAITEAAGQRNRGAVHYHFKTREQFIAAVLDLHATRWRRREEELLSHVPNGSGGLTHVIEAIIRPPVELSAHQPGRHHLAIVSDLLAYDPATLDTNVSRALAHARHETALDLIADRVVLDTPAAHLRLSMTLLLVRQAVLARARAIERAEPLTTAHDPEEYVGHLTGVAMSMLTVATQPAVTDDSTAA